MQDTQDYSLCLVEDFKRSASAIVIFTHHPRTHEPVVLKILRNMKDERYNFSTVKKRQHCQIQAWHWNPLFTPGIYLGLAPLRGTLVELERRIQVLMEIGVGPVLNDPERPAPLLKKKEYVLLMRHLPRHCRLDALLEANPGYREGEPLPSYLRVLLKRIIAIHDHSPNFSGLVLEARLKRWGSIKQLRKKLRKNLTWLEKSLHSKLIQSSELSHTCKEIKKNLQTALNTKLYQELFEIRWREKHIKRCHGDLKADNIWIEVGAPQCEEEPEICVRLLDCVDFNSSFCMIDTLSDIALLVVDIQARTGNSELANAVIDEYLRQSGEDEETAKYLLAYYMVEKAMIGMVNSYVDDKNDLLGDRYYEVVLQRLRDLTNRVSI